MPVYGISGGWLQGLKPVRQDPVGAWSFHFFFYNGTAVGSTVTKSLTLMAGGTDLCGFSWGHSTVGFQRAIYQRRANNSYDAAKSTTALATNTWYSIGGSWDGTNLKIWINGVNETTTASAAGSAGNYTLSALANVGGTQSVPGVIAEVATWAAALNSDEWQQLAGGELACNIRSNLLNEYWPLDDVDKLDWNDAPLSHGLAVHALGWGAIATGRRPCLKRGRRRWTHKFRASVGSAAFIPEKCALAPLGGNGGWM